MEGPKRKKRVLRHLVSDNSVTVADPQLVRVAPKAEQSRQDLNEEHTVRKEEQSSKEGEESRNKIRMGQQATVGEDDDQVRNHPYQFVGTKSPLHTIMFPRFACRSMTFVLSIVLCVVFAVLLVYNYTKTQNDYTWNCSLFQLQNKYFPRLRYQLQLWRVLVSSFFHSNIAQFLLNVLSMQLYGYFIEWRYGIKAFTLLLLLSTVSAHFLSCVIAPTSVSTTSSCLLYAVLGCKVVFLWEYREDKLMRPKRLFLYLLYLAVLAINLLPVFVVNNVDYGAHIAGYTIGILLGMHQMLSKQDTLSNKQKVARFTVVALILLLIVIPIVIVFIMDSPQYIALDQGITDKCT